VLPYVALLSRRVEAAAVPLGLAFAVGLVAAPGLALKHHFLLLPLFLEAWFWWRQRRFSIRPEHLALAAAALAYAAAVLVVTPEYLAVMLPLLRASYHGYNPALWILLLQPGVIVALFALAAAVLGRRVLPALGQAAAVGAGALVLVFVWQGKNFHYQAIPALGLALLTLLCLLLVDRQGGKSQDGRLVAIVGLCVALWVPFKAGLARFDAIFLEATAPLRPGQAVTIVSPSQALAWPAVYERGLGWPARTMGQWMLLAPWQTERQGQSDPSLLALGDAVRAETAATIACRRPDMVIVDKFYDEDAPGGDVFAWFMRDPRFRTAMASYREEKPVAVLRRFVRTGDRGGCIPQDLRALSRPLPR
jgi:hypothetical protein